MDRLRPEFTPRGMYCEYVPKSSADRAWFDAVELLVNGRRETAQGLAVILVRRRRCHGPDHTAQTQLFGDADNLGRRHNLGTGGLIDNRQRAGDRALPAKGKGALEVFQIDGLVDA